MFETERTNITHASDFKKLFDEYYVALCLFAERYLGNPEDAADVAQDAFIKLWQRRNDFSNLYAIKTFLYTTVRNASLNRLEHIKVAEKYKEHLSKVQSDYFFHDHVVEQERFRIVWKAIQELPNQTRRVILLALEGKDNRSIAAALEIAPDTVHTHKKIAYKRLRENIRKYFPLLFVFLAMTKYRLPLTPI